MLPAPSSRYAACSGVRAPATSIRSRLVRRPISWARASQSRMAAASRDKTFRSGSSRMPWTFTAYCTVSSGTASRRAAVSALVSPLSRRSTESTWGRSARAASTSAAVVTEGGTVSSFASLSTRTSPRATDQSTG